MANTASGKGPISSEDFSYKFSEVLGTQNISKVNAFLKNSGLYEDDAPFKSRLSPSEEEINKLTSALALKHNSYQFGIDEYLTLIKNTRERYADNILTQLKELKILGIEMVLTTINDSEGRKDLKNALDAYKKTDEIDSPAIDEIVKNTSIYLNCRFYKAKNIFEAVNDMAGLTKEFRNNGNAHYTEDMRNIIKHKEELFQEHQGIKKKLTAIVNTLSKIKGLGSVLKKFSLFQPATRTSKATQNVLKTVDEQQQTHQPKP